MTDAPGPTASINVASPNRTAKHHTAVLTDGVEGEVGSKGSVAVSRPKRDLKRRRDLADEEEEEDSKKEGDHGGEKRRRGLKRGCKAG